MPGTTPRSAGALCVGPLVGQAEGHHVDQAAQRGVVVVGEGIGPSQRAQLPDEQVALALAGAHEEVRPLELAVEVVDREADVVVADRARCPFGQSQRLEVKGVIDVEDDDLSATWPGRGGDG